MLLALVEKSISTISIFKKSMSTTAKSITPFPILFVDDEDSQRALLAGYFEKRGHPITQAGTGEEALRLAKDKPPSVAVVDMKMPGMSGIELIGRLLELEPSAQIIVLTAFGSVETAVAAMKAGAFHYQTKPVELDELTVNLEKARAQFDLVRESARSTQLLQDSVQTTRILGKSAGIEKVRELISLSANSDSPVLITGPSGSGKELVARALHAGSSRCEGRFVAVNCGAFPETLLESELFGHEKGSFTGADKRRLGRFELADKGTLFLDEIGEAPPAMQVKLLRSLETGQIERVGSEVTVDVDIRVVAATNLDLEKALDEGSFRQDLYYRLNVVRIELPALVDRPEDIPILAERSLALSSAKAGKADLRFSSEALDVLCKYNWPGNVRELQNMIERAVTLSRSNELGPELFAGLRGGEVVEYPERLNEIEKRHIEIILKRCNWNITESAEKLGIHRNTLSQKIKDYVLKE